MRRYDLDWLRDIAFTLLILYHVGMFFVLWEWHIKNDKLSHSFQYPMSFLNKWRLPLLFLISGMGTYVALSKRNLKHFAGERIKRLLVPLIFGILFIIPPQVYFERLDKQQFTGSYFDYWTQSAFAGVYPEGNISWYHLWFIVYLLFFSLILAPIFIRLYRQKENKLFQAFRTNISNPIKVYLLVLPLYLWEALLEPFFPSTHTLSLPVILYLLLTSELKAQKSTLRILLLPSISYHPQTKWSYGAMWNAYFKVNSVKNTLYHIIRIQANYVATTTA